MRSFSLFVVLTLALGGPGEVAHARALTGEAMTLAITCLEVSILSLASRGVNAWSSSPSLKEYEALGLLPEYQAISKRRERHRRQDDRSYSQNTQHHSTNNHNSYNYEQRVRHHLNRRHLHNRHQLKFSQTEYRQTVPENIPLHTSILTVHASDTEEDGGITYHVSDADTFGIDEGGVLYNIRPLDFEKTRGQYILHITAENHSTGRSGRRRVGTTARIQVTDSPEPPHFSDQHYYFSIPEFSRPGTYVGAVKAQDDDRDLDRYLLEGVEPPGMFTIDAIRGTLKVGKAPTGKQWVYNFQAVALDYHGHVTLVPVTVYIIASSPSYARLVWRGEDENTHKPTFPECEAYDMIHLKENQTTGSPVVMVSATDADYGDNGVVSYSLINDFGTFAIHSSNDHGQITTSRRLDRDDEDKEFILTVIARDGALEPLQDTCSFKVIVEDINDNAPVFDQQRYEQSLPTDHRPGSPVLRVTASDLDAGANAHVTYELLGHHADLAYFKLDQNSGILTLKQPLHESMANSKSFELSAKAVDKGSPALSSTAAVSIQVVSSGELPPSVVRQTPLHPAIPENTTENTPVVTICARSNLATSPDVYFTLLNGNTRDTNADGTFAIRRLESTNSACVDSSGVVIFVATKSLDFESVETYKLTVQIVNDHNARLDKQVVVDIIDVNDNAPLLQPFDGAVLENAGAALITTIQAVDKDASPQYRDLIYTFDATASADVMTKFTLKPNGELWTTQPLDREEFKQYRVPIQVTDGVPEHNRMTIYWITVQDLNDVPPIFDRVTGIYEVELPENREVGKPTGIRLIPDDPDIVNHFDYQIVEGNDQQKFKIDSATGDVLVNKLLDYDHPVFDRNFTLRVRLSDGHNPPAETDIVIAVTNVNDLQPVFEHANYTFTVTENTDCHLTFGQVSALDPDLPASSDQNILYYLSPSELKNFTIGHTSGELSIKGCLDRESATRGTMTLYPRANDEGGRGHDADPVTVQLVIIDLNDNHPYIKRPEKSSARIMENTEPNQVEPIIIQLDDVDSSENGCPCTMVFHEDTPAFIREKFTLDLVDGSESEYMLSPVEVLDREQQKVYQLPFITRDKQGMEGLRHLILEVGDENDSPMTDGVSNIKVYNYQGQFPAMVIGAVHVTDLDDHDLPDKTFEVDPTTASEVATRFFVDLKSGNITMLKGTPAGKHVLRVKVFDNFRGETAVGEVRITVVDLTLDAVMQSGSLRIANVTAHQMLQKRQSSTGGVGTSLYERLKREIAHLHNIQVEQVDVFTLKDVPGGVDVRYNCHSSPYYTAARLDAILLQRRRQVAKALGVSIPMVDINACLYEDMSPCGTRSCQHFMRPNLTSPLVIASEEVTMVGVDISDDYACDCGALEPLPSVCFDGFCYNGGTCSVTNNSLTCTCLDDTNYGPRCELLTSRFERGFAWYEPPPVCESSSLFMSFETNDGSGVLMYAGPIVPTPWQDYPRDFVYVILDEWVLEAYIDLGTGTMNISIPIEANKGRTFDYNITWDENGVTFEVPECGINVTIDGSEPCKKWVPLTNSSGTVSHLLNVQGPLQIGGMAAMPSFSKMAASYGWTMTPPAVYPFTGCVLELRHNEHIYDLNSTDYSKSFFQPCDAPRSSRVVLGQQSIIIILASLLCLLLLVLLILCLARRGRKSVSYPDLEREIVKETMGGTDLEGFGEKDVTHFDLKFLQVTPDGYLVNDDEEGCLPDVAQDACQRRLAPLAQMPEGLSIGDFITDNIKKVDDQHQEIDDVRHYNIQGDELSAASLSSLASGLHSTTGSTKSDVPFDYRNDWGQRFEKLHQIYGQESDQEEDSEYEFPDIPKVPKNYELRASRDNKTLTNNTTAVSSSSSVPLSSSNKNQSPSLTSCSTSATTTTTNSTKIKPKETAIIDTREQNGQKCTHTGFKTNSVKETVIGPDKLGSQKITKKKDYHETLNPMAAVNGIKGVETWC